MPQLLFVVTFFIVCSPFIFFIQQPGNTVFLTGISIRVLTKCFPSPLSQVTETRQVKQLLMSSTTWVADTNSNYFWRRRKKRQCKSNKIASLQNLSAVNCSHFPAPQNYCGSQMRFSGYQTITTHHILLKGLKFQSLCLQEVSLFRDYDGYI